MHLTHEQSFALSPGDLVELMYREDFVRFRASVPSVQVQDVVVDAPTDGTLTLTLRRTMTTDQIPAQARPFVGSTLEVRHVEAWEPERDGVRTGTVAVDITGTPVRMTGTVRLVPDGEGCVLRYEGDVRAPVPLFGAKIEEAAAGALLATLEAEASRTREWLAQPSH